MTPDTNDTSAIKPAISLESLRRPDGGTSRYLPVLAVAILGFVVSVSLYRLSHRAAERRTEAAFQRLADERIASIERGIATRVTVLDAMSAFFDASQRVDGEEFSAFASRMLLRNAGVRQSRRPHRG